jgi:hypothetical protein
VVVRPPRSYPSQTTGPSPDSPPRSNIPFDPALSAPLNIPLASSPSHATSVLLRLPESSIDQPMLEPTSPHLEYLSLSDAQYQSENSSSEPPAKRQRGRPRKYPNAPVQVDSSGTPRPLVTISPPASAHSQLSHSIITLNAAPGPSETKTPPGTLVLNFRREQRESRQKPASSIASARLETAPVAVPSSSTSNPAVPKDIGATAGFHTNGPYTFVRVFPFCLSSICAYFPLNCSLSRAAVPILFSDSVTHTPAHAHSITSAAERRYLRVLLHPTQRVNLEPALTFSLLRRLHKVVSHGVLGPSYHRCERSAPIG